MPTDIFSRQGQTFDGAFSAENATLTFAGVDGSSPLAGESGGVGLLTQSIQIGYQQTITRLFEVGSRRSYLFSGRAQGQATISRALGPRPISTAFYGKYGNVCNAATNHIQLSAEASCQGGQSVAANVYDFTMRHCVITGISISTEAQSMMIQEQLQMLFIALTLGRGA